jgi:hypothetical protein
VKRHEHLKHSAGRAETPENGQDLRSRIRAGIEQTRSAPERRLLFDFKMNKILKSIFITLAVAALLVSCKDDEPEKVSASEVAGDYVAVMATYMLHADGTITTTGETGGIEDLIDIDLVKVSVSGNKLTAKDSDGDLLFESVNLVEAGNGVVWNLSIPQSTVSEMEEYGYTVAGFEKYEMDGKKYQAFYDAKEKTVDFSLAFVSSVEENPDIVVEFVCTK